MDTENTKRVYIHEFESRIHEVDDELERLRTKAATASVEARDRIVRSLDSLVAKEKLAVEKLEQYRTAGSDRLEALHLGLEQAWEGLKRTLDAVRKN